LTLEEDIRRKTQDTGRKTEGGGRKLMIFD